MNKHHVLKGTVAVLVAAATLAGVSGMAYAADGKQAADLAVHGGAQRIAGMYGNQHAKNVILFIGDGMGDSEITVARDYLHGANGSTASTRSASRPPTATPPSAPASTPRSRSATASRTRATRPSPR
mgnify:CR=1 FL=1